MWKRVKTAGLQIVYEKNNAFNALVRRISALPFCKPEDLDQAFRIFQSRSDKIDGSKIQSFCKELIEYAKTQWRERFAVQDWNLYNINCLKVPSTNNGNEGANGRFLQDFGVHPPFWSFCLSVRDELERVNNDIPSILYGTLVPSESQLYRSLKEEREITKANYEAGLLSLDEYLGKMGALSLSTGKSKFASDDVDVDSDNVRKRKIIHDDDGNSKKRKVTGRRGRLAKNTGKQVRAVSESTDNDCIADIPNTVQEQNCLNAMNLPWPEHQGLQQIPSAVPATSVRTTTSAIPREPQAASLNCLISLSSIELFDDSLSKHIEEFKLGLRQRSPIAGDGNCWFSANVDLIQVIIDKY